MKTIFLLNLIVFSNLVSQYRYDTVYVNKDNTGSITHDITNNKYRAYAPAFNFGCGDAASADEMMVERGFISFDISSLNNKQGISQVVMGLYQYLSYGDGHSKRFPKFQNALSESVYCIIDHINYGDHLDTSDWTAGDLGDPKTIQSYGGVLSKDSVYEYKYIDVTPFVLNDLSSNRKYSQFRIRFPILIDDDALNDFLLFRGYYYSDAPILKIRSNISAVDEMLSSGLKVSTFNLYNNFPNPFNPATTIQFSIPYASNVSIKIYNIVGNCIESVIQGEIHSGKYSFRWDASSYPSGVYYCQLLAQGFSKTIKLVLLK